MNRFNAVCSSITGDTIRLVKASGYTSHIYAIAIMSNESTLFDPCTPSLTESSGFEVTDFDAGTVISPTPIVEDLEYACADIAGVDSSNRNCAYYNGLSATHADMPCSFVNCCVCSGGGDRRFDNYSDYYLYRIQDSPVVKWKYTWLGASNGDCPFNQDPVWTIKIGAGTFE